MKYNTDNCELIMGDCLVEMKGIPTGSVDMILCDLPYGVTSNKKDKRIPFAQMWAEYNRIIKPNGVIALFAQGIFYVDLVSSNKKMFRYDIVWDKILTTGFLNAKLMPLRRHEQIAVFYKKLPTYNPQFTEGIPLHSKGVKFMEAKLVNQNYGKFHATDDSRKGSTQKYPTSIIKIQKPHPSMAKHRTEKPVEVFENQILTYTNKGDIVLDNCMGAGNCGVACINTGRKFIGIELDPDTFNDALKNITL